MGVAGLCGLGKRHFYLRTCHNFVMTNDVIQHILPSNSAKEIIINYSIFKNLNFLAVYGRALCLSLMVARVLKHYLTLH